jgi:hypothetical protein
MGMFDTINVNISLIREAIKDQDINFEPYEGYCDFQTKDLDNLMSVFFIESDGSFFLQKLHQEYIPPVETDIKKGRYNFGEWKEIAPPEKIEDTRTAYIDFYDFFNTQTERIFVTFTAHVKCGKLVEPISVKSIERSDLEQEAIQTKLFNEKWEKIRKDKRWIIGSAIREARYKISRFFSPITRSIDKFQSKLLDAARYEQFPKEKEYRDSYYD